MKTLTIEWKHLDKDGATCVRCRDTGKTLAEVVGELKHECKETGVRVVFRETVLGADRIRESNQILFNGVPLENLLPGAVAGENACQSCCDLLGQETSCRTIERDGKRYEAIPESLIRAAACRVAGCC
ncbi:MAG: DUF2703 domain-containing protein [Candidatus Deferrimicrobiaceae bacterium]